MKELSKKTNDAIKCISGLCSHKEDNQKCLWNKITNAKDPNTETKNCIIKLIKAEIKIQLEKEKKNEHTKQSRSRRSK